MHGAVVPRAANAVKGCASTQPLAWPRSPFRGADGGAPDDPMRHHHAAMDDGGDGGGAYERDAHGAPVDPNEPVYCFCRQYAFGEVRGTSARVEFESLFSRW